MKPNQGTLFADGSEGDFTAVAEFFGSAERYLTELEAAADGFCGDAEVAGDFTDAFQVVRRRCHQDFDFLYNHRGEKAG